MPMVTPFAVAFLLIAAPALAGNYVVTCTGPCTASDGTTQPAGTVLNRILADPGFDPGPGLALAPDTGQAVYAPPQAAPTTIDPLAFIARFTVEEQTAMAKAAQTNPQVLLLMLKLTGAASISSSDPSVIAGVGAMVAGGWVTQARSVRVLDFSLTSP